MITEQQILECSTEDLPRLAGEVLQPEKTEHSFYGAAGRRSPYCLKCEAAYGLGEREGEECTIVDSIPCNDWNEAMKRWEQAAEEFGAIVMSQTLANVYNYESGYHNELFYCMTFARPRHYIRAACIAKIRAEGKKQ